MSKLKAIFLKKENGRGRREEPNLIQELSPNKVHVQMGEAQKVSALQLGSNSKAQYYSFGDKDLLSFSHGCLLVWIGLV